MALDYRKSLVGRELGVVVETAAGPGWVIGTACRGVKVRFPGDIEALRRQLVAVRATAVEEGELTGELAEAPGRVALAMA
jgi:hypothetical protein